MVPTQKNEKLTVCDRTFVMIFLISTAPSTASSAKDAPSNLFVSYACASARGDPLVPIVTSGLPWLMLSLVDILLWPELLGWLNVAACNIHDANT